MRIARDLRREADRLAFGPPVTHVYHPLDYAWEPHRRYLERYGRGRRAVLLVGMNPGPYGVAQTGVPFGNVVMVRDWLGITGRVRQPSREHPKRPVRGFDCDRNEVSGSRLWGWARDTFGTPGRFFASFFVYNYRPLSFMEAVGSGRRPRGEPACGPGIAGSMPGRRASRQPTAITTVAPVSHGKTARDLCHGS